MMTLLRSRITVVWAGLFGITLITYWLGTSHGFHEPKITGVVILAAAFVKVRFIGLYFMEIREAPTALRIAFEGWVLAACGIVLGLYLSA